MRLALLHALSGVYARRERLRTLLTISGIALGVAVLVAIDLSIGSALAGFNSNVRDVAGNAALTLRGNATGLAPDLLATVARTPGVGNAAPLIQGEALLPATSSATTLSLEIMGLDLLGMADSEGTNARAVRDVQFTLAPGVDFQSLLGVPGSLILSRQFARRAGLKLGDRFTLTTAGHVRPCHFIAELAGGPLEKINCGAIAICDIGVADALLHRAGQLDRIDITLNAGATPATLRTALLQRLPPTLRIDTPAGQALQAEKMLAAFRFNLNALGYISLLVGAFLILNTLQVGVIRRAPQIGTLRALGVGRNAVRGVFLIEGALLGAVGSALGVVAGVALAGGLLRIVSRTISISFLPVGPTELQIVPVRLVCAWLLGVACAVAAAWSPAQLAAATPPSNTMRRGALEGHLAPGADAHSARLLWGCASLALAVLLLALPRPDGIPLLGYTICLFIVLGFVCWAQPLLAFVIAATRGALGKLFGAEGIIAAAGARGALPRSGVAISGLLVALGMAISVSIMVASFRQTVVTWMSQVLRADLYISAAQDPASGRPEPLPERLAALTAQIPGVAQVDPFRFRNAVIDGEPAKLGAGTFTMVRYASEYRIVDGRLGNDVIRAAAARGEVIVSEVFARRHHVAAGDTVPLPTPAGMIHPRIAGVFYDYSTEQGYVIMDRAMYKQYFSDDRLDSIAIYLTPGADMNAVRAALEQTMRAHPELPAVSIRATRDLRGLALDAFEQTFRITDVMQLIAVLIAILGVANTLLSQIIDRRDEITTLLTLGTRRGRIAKIILIESGLIGCAGVLAGTVSGLLLAWVLARIIMLQSFGWTIQFILPWPQVLRMVALVFAATLAAGIFPAFKAGRISAAMGQR